MPAGDKFKESKPVRVRDRYENEPIEEYINEVARMVAMSHSHRNCTAMHCDLILPVNNEKGIGY